MSNLTPDELDQLQAMCEAATPGEWHNYHHAAEVRDQYDNHIVTCHQIGKQHNDMVQSFENGWFVVALRNAAPRLIAQARERCAYRDEVEQMLICDNAEPLLTGDAKADILRLVDQRVKEHLYFEYDAKIAAATQRAEAAERERDALLPRPGSEANMLGLLAGAATTKLAEVQSERDTLRADLDAARKEACDAHARYVSLENQYREIEDAAKQLDAARAEAAKWRETALENARLHGEALAHLQASREQCRKQMEYPAREDLKNKVKEVLDRYGIQSKGHPLEQLVWTGLESLTSERDALREIAGEALRFAQHDSLCNVVGRYDDLPCNCGLDDLRKRLEGVQP